VGAISFVHGVPQASTVAAVTHAQDRRFRRMLLNRAGLPTPPGITFSSKGSASLQRFVARHGYPFVLKEAIGENPSFKHDVSNDDELDAAISQLRVLSQDHLAPAQSLVTSGYAENRLNFDQDEDGLRIAPPHARLLIEKRVSGRHIRCLVCGGRILAAIEINATGNGRRSEMRDQLHSDFREVIVRAASVIPGLFVASIDLVAEDPTRAKNNQNYYIVELGERPRLDSYREASAHLGDELASALVSLQAERSSFALPEPRNNICVRVRMDGLSEPAVLVPRHNDICQKLQLFESMRVTDEAEGLVEGHLEGAPSSIALILEAVMAGVHFGQRAMAIDIWQEGSGRGAGVD
jgi:hypothetical protein